jgi:hypothetical protein
MDGGVRMSSEDKQCVAFTPAYRGSWDDSRGDHGKLYDGGKTKARWL